MNPVELFCTVECRVLSPECGVRSAKKKRGVPQTAPRTSHFALDSCGSNRNQLLFVSGLFRQKLTIPEFRIRVLFEFLWIKPKLRKSLHPEDVHYLVETFGFLLKEVNLTRNSLPVIRQGWRKYHGPSDGLQNCTFGEFTRANSLLDAFIRSGEQQYLDAIVAVFYRPAKWFWFIRKRFTDDEDPRRRYSSQTHKKRSKRFALLDPQVKYAVYLFFSGVLNLLPGLYPYVYQQKDTESDQENSWATLIISLADGKTDDRSLKTVMNSNLYNVLIGLNHKAKEYHQYLSKIESHDRHR